MNATWTMMKIKAPVFNKQGLSTEVECPSCFWRIFDKSIFGPEIHKGQKRWVVITEKFTKPFEYASSSPDYFKSFDTEEEACESVKKAYDQEFKRWLDEA